MARDDPGIIAGIGVPSSNLTARETRYVHDFGDLVRWYGVSLIVTLAVAPLVFAFMAPLTDRGASFVRPIAALALVWPAWFLAGIGSGLVPFGPIALWVTIALLIAAGGIIGWRHAQVDRAAWRHLAFSEAAFIAAFTFFAWLRGFGPRLTDQEKLSDLMMLSSTMRSTAMPPADAWLAGEPINYYYGGYVVWAGLAKLIDTTPAIAFNFALISIFATVVTSSIGLVANVASRWFGEWPARFAGVLGAFLIVAAGNPWAAREALTDWRTEWDAWFFELGWWSSRIIDRNEDPGAITEFPAFSFLLGDLHPHLIALPYAITALGCAWLLASLSQTRASGDLIRIAVSGALIGALYTMNSWDYPTYLVIALGALAIGTRAWAARDRLIGAGALIATSVLAWLPFYVHFETPTAAADSGLANAVDGFPVIGGVLASIVGYDGPKTPASDYLGVLGFPWLIAVALIAVEYWARRDRPGDRAVAGCLIAGVAILILGGIVIPAPVLILAGLPVVAALDLLQRDSRWTPANLALGLFAFGFALTIVPEFVFLLDIFGARMNTIFKIYYQVWLILAVASAIAVVVIWTHLRAAAMLRTVAIGGMTLVLLGGLVYPVMATNQWLNWRAPDRDWSGWDGLAFLEDDPLLAGDHAAYQWLLDHADEDDVMLSVGGCEWSGVVGRTASATGVASVIGWTGHEQQWHLGQEGFGAEIVARVDAIDTLGTSIDPALVDRYDISLIYIGAVETEGAGGNYNEPDDACAPGPFPGATDPAYPGPGWSLVYDEEGVRIFRRDGT